MQFKTWSLLKLTLVMGLAGVMLGLGIAFLIPNEFTSKATLEITPAQMSENDLAEPIRIQLNNLIQRMEWELLRRASLSAIINDPHLLLYTEDLKTNPLEDVIVEMRNNIRITNLALPGTLGTRAAAFDIVFKYNDRFKAQQTVQVLVEKLREASARIPRTLPQTAGKHSLDVIDVASLPVKPVFPDERVVILIGSVLGVSIVVAYRKLRKKSPLAWGFAISAVVFGLLGGIAGEAASVFNLLGNQYRSTATMVAPNDTPQQIAALTTEALSPESLSSVINAPNLRLYQDQLKSASLEDVIETMQRHVVFAPTDAAGHYFTISFEYGDRFKARQTVQAFMKELGEANQRLYGDLPDADVPPLASTKLEILDAPSLPITPTTPDRPRIAITGGIVGIIAGALSSTIRRRWKPEGDVPIDAVTG
jgi:hypothetical protein